MLYGKYLTSSNHYKMKNFMKITWDACHFIFHMSLFKIM